MLAASTAHAAFLFRTQCIKSYGREESVEQNKHTCWEVMADSDENPYRDNSGTEAVGRLKQHVQQTALWTKAKTINDITPTTDENIVR